MNPLSRSSNGQQRPDPDDQQTRQMEAYGARQGWQAEGAFREDILRYLADTDLPGSSKQLFANLITRDWVLANLSNAEFNELKWELRHLRDIFYAAHPADECVVVGERRAVINDDPSDDLEALSVRDKQAIEQLFRTIRLRLTRSKGMQQQRVLQTNISQTQVERQKDGGGDKGLRGWLPGR